MTIECQFFFLILLVRVPTNKTVMIISVPTGIAATFPARFSVHQDFITNYFFFLILH